MTKVAIVFVGLGLVALGMLGIYAAIAHSGWVLGIGLFTIVTQL